MTAVRWSRSALSRLNKITQYSTVKKLKRPLAKIYLKASFFYAQLALSGRSGPRVFENVKIVAPLGRQNGISSGARLQAEAMRRIGGSVELLDATPSLRNPGFRLNHSSGSAYIFHSGGPQTPNLILGTLPNAASAYRIAYWAWELPTPPKHWPRPFDLVSEVWTPSHFSKASLLNICDVPIHVVPHVVAVQPMRRPKRNTPFTVLAMADSRSSFDRKNPAGAISAFCEAFGHNPEFKLLLKFNGRKSAIQDLDDEAKMKLSNHANIEVLTEYLDDIELDLLFRSADAFISLHRAEGFGLPMLEAMARGVPVIATGWSGNMEFTTEQNSALIPYKIVPVKDSLWYSHYGDSEWAEPDIDAAATALRRLANDAVYYEAIATEGWCAAVRRNCEFSLPNSWIA